MNALMLTLFLMNAPLAQPPNLEGVVVTEGDEVPETPSKPLPPEILLQQLPFKQFGGYESALKALDTDLLLTRKISLKETYLPLNRLLVQVSNKETILQVKGEISELRLQVSLKNRPLSVLMRSLARMLPGTWKKENDGKTYTLSQTSAAQRYRRDWWALYEEESQRARKELAKHTLNFLNADPHKIGDYNPKVHTNDVSTVLEDRAVREVLRALPDDLKQHLASQYNHAMVYGHGFSSVERLEGAIVTRYRDLPNECKDALDKKFAAWFGKNPIDRDTLVLRLQNMGSLLSVQLMPQNLKDPQNMTSATVHMPRHEAVATLSPKHGRLNWFFAMLGKNVPATWYELDKFAASTVWKMPEIKKPYPLWHQSPLSEALETFATKQKGEFIAECPYMPTNFPKYIGKEKVKVITNYKPPKLPEKFETVLPVLAASADKAWHKTEEGLYLLRDNRWYRQDAAIVPEAKLTEWHKRWEELLPQTDANLTQRTPQEVRQILDLDSEIVTALTKWQILEGLGSFAVRIPADPTLPDDEEYWQRPLSLVGQRLIKNYSLLQWYAKLNAFTRNLLIEGRLPVTELTAVQRANLEYIAPEIMLCDPNLPLFLGVRTVKNKYGSGLSGDNLFGQKRRDEFHEIITLQPPAE